MSGGASRDTISYIEDCIAQLRPINLSLRLVRSILFDPRSLSQVCLLSHCGDGLALSDYQRLKTQFVQAYGFQHLVTWNNLLKVGDPICEVTNPIWRIDGIAFFFFRSGWSEWRVVLKAVKLRAGTSGSGWQWYWEIFPFTFINCINFTLGWGC